MDRSTTLGRLALEAGAAAAAPRRRQRSRKASFLIWLRRIHLYVGLWGALLGLLFGATGILLNHRSVLKIPVEKTVLRSVQLALPADRALDSPDAMARWLEAELGFDALQTRVKAEAAAEVRWADRVVSQPARWTIHLHAPSRGVAAEHHVGNRFVKVDIQDATLIGTLTRLHMAVGVNAFWVLLADTIAAGLIVLSLTGLLLWTRLHKVRLTAVCITLGALAAAGGFVWATAV